MDDEAANYHIAQLLYFQIQAPEEPIRILVNTEGGSVTATLAILDTIEFVSCPIYTFGEHSSNIAVVVLASGTKGHRYMRQNSSLEFGYYHWTQDEPPKEEDLELYSVVTLQVAQKLASYTQLSEELAQKLMNSGRSFSYAEALEAEIVDHVVDEWPSADWA